MAVTHDDLSIKKKHQTTHISGKLSLLLVIFSVLCGLATFILCLASERTRSEVTWMLDRSQCSYNGSGKTPLSLAVAAFIIIAVAMFCEHAYMLLAVTMWVEPGDPRLSPTMKDLTCQTCSLFLLAWISFGLTELLLMIGMGVESGHLTNWSAPHASCHGVEPGLFAVAGVLSLITVFLGVRLYITALRTQKLELEERSARPGISVRLYITSFDRVYPSSQPQAADYIGKSSAPV